MAHFVPDVEKCFMHMLTSKALCRSLGPNVFSSNWAYMSFCCFVMLFCFDKEAQSVARPLGIEATSTPMSGSLL